MTAHDEHSSPKALLKQLDTLIASVRDETQTQRQAWPKVHDSFEPGALNLAAWLALRRRDLRPLQKSLMALGLSSPGRLEGRVFETLLAVRASLAAVANEPHGARPSIAEFFTGEERLRVRAEQMFGPAHPTRPVAVMVTCPTEAADDPDFFAKLAQRGVEAIRINCAHDDRDAWGRMVEHARAAGLAHGRPMRIFMDLAGPKIRTGKVVSTADHRVQRGDHFAIAFAGSLKDAKSDFGHPAVECTLDAALQAAETGHRIFYDDGKLGLVVHHTTQWGLVAKVEACADKGVKLKPEKGLNFPDTDFAVDALTPKDLHDLDFVASHADAIEYSFVQSVDDVIRLQEALARRREDWRSLALVLKIETARAVTHLPEILVQAAAESADRRHDRSRRPCRRDRLQPHGRDAGGNALASRGGSCPCNLGDSGTREAGQQGNTTPRRNDRCGHGSPLRMRHAEQRAVYLRGHRCAGGFARTDVRASAQEDTRASGAAQLACVMNSHARARFRLTCRPTLGALPPTLSSGCVARPKPIG